MVKSFKEQTTYNSTATDLFINQGDDGSVDAHPHPHADKVHLLEKNAVHEGVDEEQAGVQVAFPHLYQGTWRRNC